MSSRSSPRLKRKISHKGALTLNKERLIAFTDAIIAIAATIMVLELAVPVVDSWRGLAAEWPTFLAYLISYIMIYLVWYSHHNLFEKATVVSTRTFLINGLWLFFLTLVPFTTRYVGGAPDSSVAEFLYPLDLFLWSAGFHLLDWQIRKDNPDAARDSSTRLLDRLVLYGGFLLCMVLAFFVPRASLYLIGVVSAVMIVRMILANPKGKGAA